MEEKYYYITWIKGKEVHHKYILGYELVEYFNDLVIIHDVDYIEVRKCTELEFITYF